jgi:hypothetical protein
MLQRPKPAAGAGAPGRRAGGAGGKAGAPPDAANADAAADTAEAGGRATGGELVDDLSTEDLETLEALRASLDKGAVVLRAIAELCVEKGLLTSAEVSRKR